MTVDYKGIEHFSYVIYGDSLLLLLEFLKKYLP